MREKRPGVWELRVFVGRDEHGRIKHLYRTVTGTKRQANLEMIRMRAEALGGLEPGEVDAWDEEALPAGPVATGRAPRRRQAEFAPSAPTTRRGRAVAARGDSAEAVSAAPTFEWGPDTTINDALAAWKANGWEDLSPATVRRYQNNWDVHIRRSIGTERLVDLTPFDVERFLRGLKRQGMAEASVRQIRAILHRACRLARKWSGQRLPNPVADSELPGYTLDEQRPEVRSPSAEEVRALLEAAEEWDLRVAAFIRVVAATGGRRGEIAALRWSDVDWDAGGVTIDESIVADVGGARVKPPKTRASVRRLAVDDGTMARLERLWEDRQALAKACGVELAEDAFVFSSEPDGVAAPHPDFFSHAFDKVRALARVRRDVHLHSLRHFQSTSLDSVISEAQKQSRLGWATVKMARHYTDAVSEEDRRAAEHMGAVLGE